MRVGMDIGRSGVKAETGTVRLLALPVVARLPEDPEWWERAGLDRVVRTNGMAYLESWHLGYNEDDWLVGEQVEALGLPGQYVMTVTKADPNTRLLILAALTALGASDRAEVCVGLPLHHFEREGHALHTLLRGEHNVRVAGQQRTLTLLGLVVPEGLGLWVRAVTPEGELPDGTLVRQPTVVLDFGHRTIQMGVFSGLRLYPRPYVSAHGSYEVWEAALMEALEGPGQTVYESPQRAAMLARLLREEQILVRGQQVTMDMLRPQLQAQAERIWPRIREEIRRTLEQIPYERVVAGGGGVHLFGELLREFFGDGLVVLEDRFAQAEGYRLFLEHRSFFRSVA